MKEVNKLRTQSERRRLRRHTSLFSDFSVSTDSSDSFHTDSDSTDSTESEILSPPQSPENFESNPTTRARARARGPDSSASRNDANRAQENEPNVDVVTVDVDSEISFNLRGRNVRLPSLSSESGSETRPVANGGTVESRRSSTSQNDNCARIVTEETVVRRYNPGDPTLRDLNVLPPEGSNERQFVGPVIHTTTTRTYHYSDDNARNVGEPGENRNDNSITAISRQNELPDRVDRHDREESEEELAGNNFCNGDTSLDVGDPYSSCRSSSDRSRRSEDRERRSSRSMSQSSSHSCSSCSYKDLSNSQTNYGSNSSKSPSRNGSDVDSPSYSRRHTKSSSRSPSPRSPSRKCLGHESRTPTRSYSRGRSRSHSRGSSKSPSINMHSSPSSSASSISFARFSRSRSRSQSRSRSTSKGRDSSSSRESSGGSRGSFGSKKRKRSLHKGKVATRRKERILSMSNNSERNSSSEDDSSPERRLSAGFSPYSHSSYRSESEYYCLSSPMRGSRRASSTSSLDSSFNPRERHDPNVNSKSWSSPIRSPHRSPLTDGSSREKTRPTRQSSFSDDVSENSDMSFTPDTPLSLKQRSRTPKSSESCRSMSTASSVASDTSSPHSSVAHVQENDGQDNTLSSDHNSPVHLNSTLSSLSSHSSPSSSSPSSEAEHKFTEEEQLSEYASPWESPAESHTVYQVSSPSIEKPHNDLKSARTDQGSSAAKYTESLEVRVGNTDQRPSKGSRRKDSRANLKQSASASSSTSRTLSEVTLDPQVTQNERLCEAGIEMQSQNLPLPCQTLLTTGASVPLATNKLTEQRKENSGSRKKRSHSTEVSETPLTKIKKTCKISPGPSAHNSTSSSLLWFNNGSSKPSNPTVNVKIGLSLNVEPRSTIPSCKEQCTRTSSKPRTVCSSSSAVTTVSTVMEQSKIKSQSEQCSKPPKQGASKKSLPGNEIKSQNTDKLQKPTSKKTAAVGKPSAQAKRQGGHSGHTATGASETRNGEPERHSVRREEQGGQSADRHLFLQEDTDDSSDDSWSPGRHSDATDLTISEEIESDSSYELVVPKSTKQLLDELVNTNDDSDDTWSPNSYFSPSP